MLVEPLDDVWDEARVVRAAIALSARSGFVWLDANSPPEGRWSWLGVEPVERVVVGPDRDVLAALGQLTAAPDGEQQDLDPPRWIGLIAYDALWGGALDGQAPRRGSRHAHTRAVMRFGRYDALVGIDHASGRAWLAADDAAAARRLREALEGAPDPAWPRARVDGLRVTGAEAHADAIEEARAAIARGELYQVNLARRWTGDFEGAPLALALAMRAASPVPFGLFLREGERAWVTRSMERFLAWAPDATGRGVLETRPIKGTVARDRPREPLAQRCGETPAHHGETLGKTLPPPHGETPPRPHGETPPRPHGETPPRPHGETPPRPHGETHASDQTRAQRHGETTRTHGESRTQSCGESRPERRGDEAVERLRADPKELAEHAMIVDLLRNDLARVAETGSVEVVAPMVVEAYAKLHHLVSTVRCTTRAGTSLRDVLAATFPPGSVTGAPKAAAVALIDALEPFARGSYCGAHGYVSRNGRLSLSVSIRSAEIEGTQVSYFAGGGIVWPSDARREVAETELKARVFLDAVEALGSG